MPAAPLLVPPGVLVVGALVTWALGLAGFRTRWVVAGAAWASVAALIVAWLLVGREPTEVGVTAPTDAVPPVLRLDAAAFAFGICLLPPLALLLTFQRRTAEQAGLAALAAAAALFTLEAGSLLLTAAALSVCTALVMLALRDAEEPRAERYGPAALLAALGLLWAAVTVVVLTGGTSLYSAVPVGTLTAPVFFLLLLVSALCSGIVPWRTWVTAVWERKTLEEGALAVALLVPLGLFLLFRTYTIGGGSWHAPWLRWFVGALGAVTALAAALRAQAAQDRRMVLGELVPLGVGLAVVALSLGTIFGLAAGITGVAALALGAALGMLVPAGGRIALLGAAVVAGAPPGFAFGARLLIVQSSLEGGPGAALWALLVTAVWFLGYAAAARTIALPGHTNGSRTGGVVAAIAGLAAGAALGPFEAVIALPAATEVIRPQGLPITISAGELVTASGGWGALSLGVLVLLVLGGLVFLTRPMRATEPRELPAPLIPPPSLDLQRLRARLPGGGRTPPLPLGRLERAMEASPPWFWAAVAFVLAVVVTR